MEYVVLSNPTVNSNMLSLSTLKCSEVYGSSESASLIMSYQVIMTVRWEIAAHPQSPYIQYTHWIQVFNIVFGWTRSGDLAQISRKKRKTQIRTKHMVKTACTFLWEFSTNTSPTRLLNLLECQNAHLWVLLQQHISSAVTEALTFQRTKNCSSTKELRRRQRWETLN